MPDSTSVKLDINRIYKSNWMDELEENEHLLQLVKSRIRDLVMSTPRTMTGDCGSQIDWIDWAGVEVESELDSLIDYCNKVYVLGWIKQNLEIGYTDDVVFPEDQEGTCGHKLTGDGHKCKLIGYREGNQVNSEEVLCGRCYDDMKMRGLIAVDCEK